MALEVVGAGFGRTGTMSLKLALEQLGYVKCHHMREVAGNKRQERLWSAIANGEDVDWDEVFDGYSASCDWPSAAYWPQLVDHFPDSKVILTVRDADRWYESAAETIFQIGQSVPGWVTAVLPRIRRIRDMTFAIVWDGVLDGRFEDRDFALRTFRENTERVKDTVPAERLLVFEVADGWEPLCAFLRKPVPDTPFPRVNEAAQMRRYVVALKAIRWLPLALALLLIGVVAL